MATQPIKPPSSVAGGRQTGPDCRRLPIGCDNRKPYTPSLAAANRLDSTYCVSLCRAPLYGCTRFREGPWPPDRSNLGDHSPWLHPRAPFPGPPSGLGSVAPFSGPCPARERLRSPKGRLRASNGPPRIPQDAPEILQGALRMPYDASKPPPRPPRTILFACLV